MTCHPCSKGIIDRVAPRYHYSLSPHKIKALQADGSHAVFTVEELKFGNQRRLQVFPLICTDFELFHRVSEQYPPIKWKRGLGA
jgi:hypothetical protein